MANDPNSGGTTPLDGNGDPPWGSPQWVANQQAAASGTGRNWSIPRPGMWGGVPYYQGDLQGNPLSRYANLVDQIHASQQPIPLGQQFNRWNFGGPAWQTGTQGGGLLGGTSSGLLNAGPVYYNPVPANTPTPTPPPASGGTPGHNPVGDVTRANNPYGRGAPIYIGGQIFYPPKGYVGSAGTQASQAQAILDSGWTPAMSGR